MTATMMRAEVHWVALKKLPWEMKDGTRVMFEPEDLLPLEETQGLRGHIIDRLVEAGKIGPVSFPGDAWVLNEAERRGLVVGGGGTMVAPSETDEPAPEDDDEDDDEAVHAGFPRHVDGQTYVLSNGESVRGKRAATAAQAELTGV